MNETTTQEDLAYVRAIAEEGRNVPLVGGPMFVVWGGVIGTAALLCFLDDIGLTLPVGQLWLWSGALGLGWLIGAIVNRRVRSTPGASTKGNQVAAAAWMSCGVFLTVFWLSILTASLIGSKDGFPFHYLFAAMFPVAFGFYGLAFMVTAQAVNLAWMRWVAVGSWVASSLLVFSLNTGLHMLIAGLATYCVALVPGLVLIKSQPSRTV